MNTWLVSLVALALATLGGAANGWWVEPTRPVAVVTVHDLDGYEWDWWAIWTDCLAEGGRTLLVDGDGWECQP